MDAKFDDINAKPPDTTRGKWRDLAVMSGPETVKWLNGDGVPTEAIVDDELRLKTLDQERRVSRAVDIATKAGLYPRRSEDLDLFVGLVTGALARHSPDTMRRLINARANEDGATVMTIIQQVLPRG